jgi:N6-adenosine-specific RNA methylase IME4
MTLAETIQNQIGAYTEIENQLACVPDGYAKAVLIDLPWGFKTRAPNKNPKSDRSVDRKYRTMTMTQIKAFMPTIKRICNPKGCHVFMWTTGPFLEKAFPLLRSAGARYSSTAFYYLKIQRRLAGQIELITTDPADLESIMHMNLGFTTRGNIEPCLLGRIGSPKRNAKDVRELIIDWLRQHSEKPEQTRDRIERYCDGPYVDIFSRRSRPGWITLGDQIGKFDTVKIGEKAA